MSVASDANPGNGNIHSEHSPYSGVDHLEILADARNYNKFLTDQVIRNGRGAVSALDFGAGIGTFSVALRAAGKRVVCVEPDLNLLDRLRRLGFEAYSNVDEIKPVSLDYVYSLNVLEHVEDDLQVLKRLASRMRPGGRLLLYVPAFDILYSSMDKKVGHFRRYRRPILVPLLKKAGLRVERAIYVDSLGFGIALIYKLFGNREGNLNPRMVKFYDSFIFPVSRMLDHLSFGTFGKNLLITARR